MKIPERIVLKTLWENPRFYEILEGYKIPIVFPEVNIEFLGTFRNNFSHREKLLEMKETPNIRRMIELLNLMGIRYIREFLIPIIPSEWKSLYHGRSRKEFKKRWFSLDFYLPEYNLAIQLDSIIGHSGNLFLRDLAIDKYLFIEYGIETLRSSKMQFDNFWEEESKRIKTVLSEYRKVDYKIDFGNTFYRILREIREEEFDIIETYFLEPILFNDLTGERMREKKISLKGLFLSDYTKKRLNFEILDPYLGTRLTRLSEIKFLISQMFGIYITGL